MTHGGNSSKKTRCGTDGAANANDKSLGEVITKFGPVNNATVRVDSIDCYILARVDGRSNKYKF